MQCRRSSHNSPIEGLIINNIIDNFIRGKPWSQTGALRACVGLAALLLSHGGSAQTIELRLSVETPPSHARNLAAARWADAIERRSNGALGVRLFPNGQLYDSPGAIKALASGALDLSVQASPTLSRFEPNLSVIALPMFFGATREQVRDILDGSLGAELYDRLAAKGILVPGGHFEYAPNNTAYTTDKVIRSYEDLRGVKLATPPSPLLVVMLRSMGAFPVATPRTEIVLQLSQGQIDGLGSMTDLTISGGKLWDAGIRYAFRDTAGWGVYVPLVSEVTWNELSSGQRDAVRFGWEEVKDWARAYTETELDNGIEINRRNGIVSFSPSAEARDRMRARLVAEQDSLVEKGRMDAGFVARVQARLAELQ
jgi:TRAP-type C4-dicarboxylate transport system substrate-binding protein